MDTHPALTALYNEAVVVSNAAEAFDHLVEFDTTVEFVENIQNAQRDLIVKISSLMEPAVIAAAASGAKFADIFTFKGGDLHEGYNILFMMFGGVEQERRDQLEQYGFHGCFNDLVQALAPFYVKHSWDRATNDNTISVFWE
ncbi:hypothetical protein PBCVNW6652_472L [Paramecium bursaria Chlorella virus NW665.2]|nr:hypothetical protein PBCVNW6652_472L [Paramecium bursaria Chlorella virus NW665.2]